MHCLIICFGFWMLSFFALFYSIKDWSIRLNDLKGLFKPEQFCGSVIFA